MIGGGVATKRGTSCCAREEKIRGCFVSSPARLLNSGGIIIIIIISFFFHLSLSTSSASSAAAGEMDS